jgi:hypothetical protein
MTPKFDILIGHQFERVVAEDFGDHRLDLDLGEVDADADARPATEADERVWRLLLLLARRGEAIQVETGWVREDAG